MRKIVSLACAAVAVATAACEPGAQDASANDSANAASAIDRLPVAERPLDRAALLMAAARAASAVALGQSDTDQRRRLDGKRFEVRIRFGCPADLRPPSGSADPQPQRDPARFDVKFGEVDRMLRIRAAPDLNVGDPLVASIRGETFEAVEGFWLRRPWLLAEGCPPAPPPPPVNANPGDAPAATKGAKAAAASPAPAPTHRVGIAEFFTEADSRAGRRDGRAYETTKVLGGVQRPSDIGYNLVLSGRLRQLPSGQVITCVAANPDEAPQCVISADFDRVRIEAPGTREVLAEWSR